MRIASLRSPLALAAAAGFLAVAASGCPRSEPAPARPGAAKAPAQKAAPSPASDTGGIGAPKIPWAQKTRSQRQDYMGLFVLPRMEKLFKEWRPDDYAGFRCQTCHGENFDKPPVDFEMPRVSFPLDADDPIGKAMKYDEEATKFMTEKVLPTMADLLGEKPYDSETGEGFSCFRCHPSRKKSGS
jgi:hypothetical protein